MKFSSASLSDDEIAAVGLTPSEYRVITGESGKVKVRFRLLEIFSSLTGIEY